MPFIIAFDVHIFRFERLVRLLHQRLEVPHPEEPGDEPVRIEPLEILDRLAAADECNTALGLGHRRHGTAAFCGTVHLGDDDTVDTDRFVETACLFACLLAECCIDHEPAVGCFREDVEVDDLLDQVRLKGMPALGIDDDQFLLF